MNSAFNNVPEISFIGGMSLDELQQRMVAWYEERYTELTGETVELAKANPYRLILYACTMAIYQSFMYVDTAGKNNLLKYSYGGFLDNIGTLRGITRSPGTKASATFRFSLASARSSVTAIPAGSRMNVNNIFFATTEYAEIPIGGTYVDVLCECTETGTKGNGYVAGTITAIVDSLPYIDHAANTTETANGADIESDNDFAERIYLAPNSYSVAGPKKAYEYFTKEVSSNIADVNVSNPSAGSVKVCFIMNGGQMPDATMIQRVSNYLNSEERRPLTDTVTVAAPTASSYNIAFTYYINRSDSASAAAIQTAVTAAASEYKLWQDQKIGRDINPDKLRNLVLEAGAKRITVTSPSYTAISADYIPQGGTITITYGGLEDD